jgi:fructose-specific phosphotransferase system component IIB
LSSFSNSSDFINSDNFITNSKLACQNINLLECTHKNILAYIKEKGSISVSPYHPSRQFIEYTRKKEEELEKIKVETQKKIGEEKRKSEQEIQSLKAEYSTVDKKMADLNRQVETERSTTISFKQKLELNDQELIKIKNFNDAKLKEAENIINDLKNKQPQNTSNGELKNTAKLVPMKYYLFLITVLLTLLVLLGFVFFSVKQSIDNDRINKDINSKVDVLNKKIEVLTGLLNSGKRAENNTKEKPAIQPVAPPKGPPTGSPDNKKTVSPASFSKKKFSGFDQ